MITLAQLEKKDGRLRTVHTAQLALEKAATDPGALTDEDLAVIAYFHPGHRADEARAARDTARGRAVDPPAPVATTASAAIEFPSELWDTEAADQVAEMDRWSKKFAGHVLPVAVWWAFVKAGREKREALEQEVKALKQEVKALKQEVEALKAQPKSLDYCGVWQRAIEYRRNQATTHRGSIWSCLTDARGIEPGTAPAIWQLSQKEDLR
jgi:hypothetical protein